MVTDQHTLARLFATIEARKGADPASSYTAKLFGKGKAKIAQKLGEEAVETVIAAMALDTGRGDKAEVAAESADLLYHLLVLWAETGVAPDDVWAILDQREGTSGIAEKASRKE